MGLARSMVMYSTVVASKAKTVMTIHSLRLIMGVVKPPTKEMANASTTSMILIGMGMPAFRKASRWIPISNKSVNAEAISPAGPLVSGFLDKATVRVHKAVAVTDNA